MVAAQKRIYFAIFFAMPFIAIGGGDAKVQLVMATIEEFVVVFVYAVLGVFTPKSSGEKGGRGRGAGQFASGVEVGVPMPNMGYGQPAYGQQQRR
ncbi:hypothetical protein BDV12DRAFT_199979 [Aspergillus spectabilis]